MQAAEAKGSRKASGSSRKGPAGSPAKPSASGGGWRVCSAAVTTSPGWTDKYVAQNYAMRSIHYMRRDSHSQLHVA